MSAKYKEVKPKTYPTQILSKDWPNRMCVVRSRNGKEQEITDLIHDLKVRNDDVWIVTLPKCGTTWMQELVWLVLHDYDFDYAKKVPLEMRSPFVEITFELENTLEDAVNTLNNYASPRLIKTHKCLPLLPAELWNKKPKTIYVIRDPKDAMVSGYHHRRFFGYYRGQTIEEEISEELAHEMATHNFFNFALEFYDLRNEPWLLYTSFEKMKSNLRQVILDVCQFLNKSITEDQMSQMLKHLSFEEMKKNPQVNHIWEKEELRKKENLENMGNIQFIRKGQMGSHREELPSELVERLDSWTQDSLPQNITLNDLLLIN